jgi:hypothetical protein
MPDPAPFASATVPRHLARGALGFTTLIGAFALVPHLGPGSLVLAPLGLLALRGCPMCWVVGLVLTVSRGRLNRSCADGRCAVVVPKPHEGPEPIHGPDPSPDQPRSRPSAPPSDAVSRRAVSMSGT